MPKVKIRIFACEEKAKFCFLKVYARSKKNIFHSGEGNIYIFFNSEFLRLLLYLILFFFFCFYIDIFMCIIIFEILKISSCLQRTVLLIRTFWKFLKAEVDEGGGDLVLFMQEKKPIFNWFHTEKAFDNYSVNCSDL